MPPSSLEIRQLRALVALVEHESVTAAAQSLGVAQSTLSEALSALERVVGTQLVLRRRGNQAFKLTAAGEALLPHARKVLAHVAEAQVAMAALSPRAQGDLHIVANESVSTYVLAGVLPALRRDWPNTRFTVSVATCAGVREGVSGGAFDVGLLLRYSAGGASSGDATTSSPLHAADRHTVASGIPLVFFAGGAHPLVRGNPPAVVRRDALIAYPLFVSDAAGDFHDYVRRLFRRDGAGGPPIEAIGTVEGVKKAVIADRGAVGVLPAYAVSEELRSATVKRIPLKEAPPPMHLDALLSRSRTRHPSAEALLRAVREAFGRGHLSESR